MEDNHGFAIPQSFLTQLSEYTRGYMLIVCNEQGELYVHEAYDNPVIKLGLINYGEMHINAAQQHMHNMALEEEQRLEGRSGNNADDDDDDDKDND